MTRKLKKVVSWVTLFPSLCTHNDLVTPSKALPLKKFCHLTKVPRAGDQKSLTQGPVRNAYGNYSNRAASKKDVGEGSCISPESKPENTVKGRN